MRIDRIDWSHEGRADLGRQIIDLAPLVDENPCYTGWWAWKLGVDAFHQSASMRPLLDYASSGIDGADQPYHPHALAAMRCAEKLLREMERRELELAQATGDLVGDWPPLIGKVRSSLQPGGETREEWAVRYPNLHPEPVRLPANYGEAEARTAAAGPGRVLMRRTVHIAPWSEA